MGVFAKVIAAAVASDKEKYNEAFLAKQNEEYCAWILNPEKWGGIFASIVQQLGYLLKYGFSTGISYVSDEIIYMSVKCFLFTIFHG